MDLSLGMKYTNMIIVTILALRFLIKLRFPANTPISTLIKFLHNLHECYTQLTKKMTNTVLEKLRLEL